MLGVHFCCLVQELGGLGGNVTKRHERQRHEVKGVVDKDMPILRNFA